MLLKSMEDVIKKAREKGAPWLTLVGSDKHAIKAIQFYKELVLEDTDASEDYKRYILFIANEFGQFKARSPEHVKTPD